MQLRACAMINQHISIHSRCVFFEREYMTCGSHLSSSPYLGAMLIEGFRPVPCPLWLLDISSAVIVPCANYIPSASGTQTNPLYSAPPNNHNPGTKLADHWGDAITGTHFQIAPAFGFYFLYAKVQPLHGPEAYINVWRGKSLESQQRGTMYCSLRSKPNCEHQCLCGDCKPEWLRQGWICRYMCWA